MSHIRSFCTVVAALIVAASLATPLAAQGVSQATAVQGTDSVSAVKRAPVPELTLAPTRAGTTFGMRAIAIAAPPLPAPAPAYTARNTALMIVGGAALVVGSIVGGDTGNIIMIGGAVVGLVGLWRYLQ